MPTPLSTGAAARELGCTEPRLNDLIRRGKLQPPPLVVGGRRWWYPEHVEQAAEVLGVELAEDTRQARHDRGSVLP